MKKVRSILTILVVLLICLSTAACGEGGENRGSEEQREEPEMTVSKYGFYTYQDVLFFESHPALMSEEPHTLKYINLGSTDEKGVEVYGGEGEDIFESSAVVSMIDREATEENGGVPVLIAAKPLDPDAEDPYGPEARFQLVSYDMATGKTKVLVESIEMVKQLAIYRDKIYYIQFRVTDSVEDPTGVTHSTENYVLSAVPRDGGKPERIYMSKGDSLTFGGSHDGKLYLNLNDTQKIVRCDIDGKNAEEVFSYSRHEANLLFWGGDLYYETDEGKVSQGENEVETSKLCRLPLDGLQDKEEKDGETVLENLYRIDDIKGSKIYYYSATDGNSSASVVHDFSVLHAYDAASGKDTVVYDFSDQKDYVFSYVAVTDNYIVLRVHRDSELPPSENDDFTRGYVIIHRETGEYRPWTDLEEWETE